MSDNNNALENASKKSTSWFKGLKAEYRKIVWESREDVQKETVAVLAVSIVLGVVIAIVDMILQYGIDFILGI